MDTPTTEKPKRRGFASMSDERKREIAAQGGRIAHEMGLAHEWTPEEASIAGKRGGTKSRRGPKKRVEQTA